MSADQDMSKPLFSFIFLIGLGLIICWFLWSFRTEECELQTTKHSEVQKKSASNEVKDQTFSRRLLASGNSSQPRPETKSAKPWANLICEADAGNFLTAMVTFLAAWGALAFGLYQVVMLYGTLAATNRNAEAAQVAAVSAKISSEVAHKSVMPILYPYITQMVQLHPLQIVEIAPPEPWRCRLLIRLDNSGKTPALVKEFRARLFLTTEDEIPERVDTSTFEIHGHPATVPASAAGLTGDIDLVQNFHFSRHDLEMILSDGHAGTGYKRFVLIGQVIYDDLFDYRHTCYFCIKMRSWIVVLDGTRQHKSFQISRGSKNNRFAQGKIPDPDPLESAPEPPA